MTKLKTIVVSGACSNIGKSTLAKKIASLIQGAVIVKIGHHPFNVQKSISLFPMGTPFSRICESVGDAPYLIIESNSILYEITPDATFYIPSDFAKSSATIAQEKADIICGVYTSRNVLINLAHRLNLPECTIIEIVEFAKTLPLLVNRKSTLSKQVCF